MKLLEIDKRSREIAGYSTDKTKYFNAVNNIKKHCSDAVAALIHNKIIYKGMQLDNSNETDIWLTNPAFRARKSHNTRNYYTLMFNNLPSWKDYPKRSRSLICATSAQKASMYRGDLYVILPFNSAKIAVCPRCDIWDSFYKSINATLNDFNNDLEYNNISDANWPTMLSTLLKYNKNIEWSPIISSIVKKINNCKTREKLILVLDKIFNPVKNGFKLTDITNIPRSDVGIGQELWTSDKSYIIRHNSDAYFKLLE
jgi:hypothetical protein